jgi:hypothetical protein
MNFDTIEFKPKILETEVDVNTGLNFEEDSRKKIKVLFIDLYLNGEHFKHSKDDNVLLHPKTEEEYIFTCSCGIPGCAGIWEPMKIKVRKETIEWRIPKPRFGHSMGYEFLPKSFYSFNKKQYMEALKSLRDSIQALPELDEEVHIDYPDYYCDLERTLLSNNYEKFGFDQVLIQ